MPARKLAVLATFITFALCACSDAQALDARTHTHGAKHPRIAKAIQHGKISWYGRAFAGHRTASGERFDPHALTMAHRSLPLGAIVEVTNNANGKQVRVRVNDRGPYCRGRVADLSRAASKRLDFVDDGVTDATLRVVSVPHEALASVATHPAAAPSG